MSVFPAALCAVALGCTGDAAFGFDLAEQAPGLPCGQAPVLGGSQSVEDTLREPPAVYLCRNTEAHRVLRHVLVHERKGSNDCTVANRDSLPNDRARADPHIMTHRGRLVIHALVAQPP